MTTDERQENNWRGKTDERLRNIEKCQSEMNAKLDDSLAREHASVAEIGKLDLRMIVVEDCIKGAKRWLGGIFASLVVLVVVTLVGALWKASVMDAILQAQEHIK